MKLCEKCFCVKVSYVPVEALHTLLLVFFIYYRSLVNRHGFKVQPDLFVDTNNFKLLIVVYIYFVKTHCMFSKLEAVINLQILWYVWCVLLKLKFLPPDNLFHHFRGCRGARLEGSWGISPPRGPADHNQTGAQPGTSWDLQWRAVPLFTGHRQTRGDAQVSRVWNKMSIKWKFDNFCLWGWLKPCACFSGTEK